MRKRIFRKIRIEAFEGFVSISSKKSILGRRGVWMMGEVSA
jgi:hypothetical protein